MSENKVKTPVVKGALGERPLPRLLQQLYRKKFTGYFVVTDQTKDESEIYMRQGAPVHVRRPVDTDRLDNLLVEYGVVPAEIVTMASAQVSDGLRLGDVLERMGALDKDKLAQVLKSQVIRKLTRLFFVAEGTYAIYVDSHVYGEGGDLPLMRVEPQNVIYQGIRAAYDLPRVTRELKHLLNQRFRLTKISPSFIAAMGIPPGDSTVEALGHSWMTLDDLDSITSRPLEVRSITLALYYSDLLEREPITQIPSDSAVPRVIRQSPSSDVGMSLNLSGDSVPNEQIYSEEDATVPTCTEPTSSQTPNRGVPVITTPYTAPSASQRMGSPARGVPVIAPHLTPPSAPQRMGSPARGVPVVASPLTPASAPQRLDSPAHGVPIITPHITPPSQKEFRPSPVPAAAAAPSAPVHPAVAQPHSKPSGYTPPQETPVIRAAFASSVRAKSESRPIEIKAQPAAGVKPQPPTQSASTAPARQSLLLDGMRANIQDMAQKMGKVTHFELLGLSQDCTSDEVGTAFVRAARQFHPDRLVAAGLQDLQPIAERILARINEATMVLSDPARRAEYLASLAMGGSGGQTSLPSLLEAENLFLRGEVYLKRGEYAKAAELFKSAAQGNPSEPQYRAFLAWARFEDPKARKETLVRDTLKVIEGVVKDRPRFARGFFWIGQCWKFLNEMDKAAHAFRETVQIDSSFIDASRELRLIEMRKSKANSTKSGKSGSNPSHGGGGGLMGKFFKK